MTKASVTQQSGNLATADILADFGRFLQLHTADSDARPATIQSYYGSAANSSRPPTLKDSSPSSGPHWRRPPWTASLLYLIHPTQDDGSRRREYKRTSSSRASSKACPERSRRVAGLKKAARLANMVVLAMDPDREGEAIAWHIQQVLRKELPDTVLRATFHEIPVLSVVEGTESAIKRALVSPSQLDIALVRAQEARRVVDRLMSQGATTPLLPLVTYTRHTARHKRQTVAKFSRSSGKRKL